MPAAAGCGTRGLPGFCSAGSRECGGAFFVLFRSPWGPEPPLKQVSGALLPPALQAEGHGKVNGTGGTQPAQ